MILSYANYSFFINKAILYIPVPCNPVLFHKNQYPESAVSAWIFPGGTLDKMTRVNIYVYKKIPADIDFI
jgi:hypothetical protein